MADRQCKPRLLFFVSEDWFFCSHRLPLALAAIRDGFDVTVVTRERSHGHIIRNAGIQLIPFEIARRGMNPFAEVLTILKLVSIYRQEQPDVVHHVAMKPVLYGSIAARAAGVVRVVNALTGLGWIFIARNFTVSILRKLVQQMLRMLLGRGIVIVQNPDDMALLEKIGVARTHIRLIRGSGVDLTEFAPHTARSETPVILLVSRMLWDKGVGEFVQAARLLKQQGIVARFALVGGPDEENPASIPEATLQSWVAEEIVEWWGHRQDMPSVYAQAAIACLPSYREGLPKALLEAAACGLPIVTTDVPGCREVVLNDETGFLVPERNVDMLMSSLRRLIENADLRMAMGKAGRLLVEQEFSIERVSSQTLDIYRQLLQIEGRRA